MLRGAFVFGLEGCDDSDGWFWGKAEAIFIKTETFVDNPVGGEANGVEVGGEYLGVALERGPLEGGFGLHFNDFKIYFINY